MKKIWAVANGAALIATIIINYLSNTGIFNGNTWRRCRPVTLLVYAGRLCVFHLDSHLSGPAGFCLLPGTRRWRQPGGGDGCGTGRLVVYPVLRGQLRMGVCLLYDKTGLSVLIMMALLFCLLQIVLRTDME